MSCTSSSMPLARQTLWLICSHKNYVRYLAHLSVAKASRSHEPECDPNETQPYLSCLAKFFLIQLFNQHCRTTMLTTSSITTRTRGRLPATVLSIMIGSRVAFSCWLFLLQSTVSAYVILENFKCCRLSSFVKVEIPKPSRQQRQRPQQRYDMGLGKNPPISRRNSNNSNGNEDDSSNEIVDNLEDAASFWMEHKAMFDLSPRRRETNGESSAKSPSVKRENHRSMLPVVECRRRWKDALEVVDVVVAEAQSSSNGEAEFRQTIRPGGVLPTMVPAVPVRSLDPNTAWVELLLHHQEWHNHQDQPKQQQEKDLDKHCSGQN